jgi:hypothetical protein
MTRGWTSQDLPVVADDPALWTIADAVARLGPLPNDPPNLPAAAVATKLRILARCLGLTPVGKRRTSPTGHPGRYARVYTAQSFIDLYEMVAGDDEQPPLAA